MGDTLADKLLRSIEVSKRRPLSRLLFALGIRHVGRTTAKILAKRFASLDQLAQCDREQLTAIHEVGDKVADSLIDYLNNPDKILLLAKLKAAGVTPEAEVMIQQDGPLSDKTFVITGTLTKWSRQEAEQLVEKFGGRAAGSVSKKTDYVLAGENAGSKLDKARMLGIEILDEEAFSRMIGRKT
jgi:DNA ligase (NAD+)